MSRSRRKTPICGITTASSERHDKRLANQRLRRSAKTKLRCGLYDEDLILPELDDVSNPWEMSKDGKQRFDPNSKWGKKLMRK
jgi:hypothetical protein